MQIITTAIIKGGTGKTTTAAALAQAAAAAGKKVLAIDLDPQANLTFALAADQTKPGAYQVITGELSAAKAIQVTSQGIAVIPASPDLSTVQKAKGSGNRLKKALEPVQNIFDLCIIDTPPTLGEMTYNALLASTGLLVPLEADTSSLQGLYQITDTTEQLRRVNPDLKVLGVVVTRYDSRSNFTKYMLGVIREKCVELNIPFLTAIRSGVAIREAAGLQKSIYEYAGNSKPAADYMQLYKTLMGE